MLREAPHVAKLVLLGLALTLAGGCVASSPHPSSTLSAVSPASSASPDPTAAFSPSPDQAAESSNPSSESPPPSARTVAGQAWTARGLHAISKPVVAAGRVVFMTTGENNQPVNQPFLVALDEQTGRVVWRADASDAAVTLGVEPSVLTKDGVIYSYDIVRIGGVNALDAYVVAHSAATGKLLWTSSKYAQFNQYPSLCSDSKALCMSANDDRGDGSQALRIDLRTGDVTAQDDEPFAPHANLGRAIGTDLYDPLLRNPESVAHYVDGRLIWTARLDSLFPAGFTTDDGWDFHLEGDTYFGSVGPPPGSDRYVLDASQAATAGFDRDSGLRRWLDVGSGYFCSDILHATHVRCRFQGTVTMRPDKGLAEATFTGFSATVEGFDPQTGATTWSWNAGDAPGLFGGEPALSQVGDGTVIVTDTVGHHTVLDPRTGAHHPAPDDQSVWCTMENVYHYSVPYGPENDTRRAGTPLLTPCSLDGTPVNTPSRDDENDGIVDGNLFVWAQDDGVHAVHLSPTP